MKIAAVVFAACATLAVAVAAHAAGKDEAAIRASSAAFLAAYNAGDANAVLTHFEDTAVVMPPNLPPLRGTAEIRQFVERGIANAKAGGITLALASGSEVGVSDKLAYHSGAYSASKASAAIDDGKYLETWHKSGGTWRMIRRAWSSNHPAAAPPAAPK